MRGGATAARPPPMAQHHYARPQLHSLPFSLLRSFDDRFPMCDARCGADAGSRGLVRVIGPLRSASAVHQASCPSERHGQDPVVAKRVLVSFERGEHHAVLVQLVPVVEQVVGHESNVPPRRRPDIGALP